MKKNVLSLFIAMALSVVSVYAAPTYSLSTMSQETTATAPAVPETKASDGAKENYFELAGVPNRGYYLLETMTDGRHFVLTNETYGKAAWDTKTYTPDSGEGRFPNISTTSETNIMYKLNTWLYQGKTLMGGTEEDTSNGYIFLDSTIRSNIVTNTKWPCFGDYTDPSGQFTITAPISVLDLDEVRYYRGKFANKIDIPVGRTLALDYWSFTRRPRYHATAATDTFYATRTYNAPLGGIGFVSWSDPHEIRPCFYLNEDFFLNVKLNIYNEETNKYITGSNVINYIKGKYSRAQLSNIYSDSELAQLGFANETVRADNMMIVGIPAVGQKLQGRYTYYNTNPSASENGTEYAWYICDTKDGDYTVIDGANETFYTVRQGDVGKYLKFGVTPKDSDGEAVKENRSQSTIAVLSEQSITPVVTDCNITESGASAEFGIKSLVDAKLRLIIGAYDKNNMLLAFEIEECTISAGETINNIAVSTSFTKSEVYTIRIMAIDDLGGFQPLCAYEIK